MRKNQPNSPTGGFTLIELLVSLLVAAILLVIVPPSLHAIKIDAELKTVANALYADILLARSTAITRGTSSKLYSSSASPSTSGAADWSVGWRVTSKTKPIRITSGLPKDILVSTAVDSADGTLSFNRIGALANASAAQFVVCPVGSTGNDGIRLDVSKIGTPRETGHVSCPAGVVPGQGTAAGNGSGSASAPGGSAGSGSTGAGSSTSGNGDSHEHPQHPQHPQHPEHPNHGHHYGWVYGFPAWLKNWFSHWWP